LLSCYSESEPWADSNLVTHQYRDAVIVNAIVIIENLPKLRSPHQS